MKRDDKVRVKLLANLPDVEKSYRGRIGTVIADSEPGEVILVEFDGEVTIHQFLDADLEKLDGR